MLPPVRKDFNTKWENSSHDLQEMYLLRIQMLSENKDYSLEYCSGPMWELALVLRNGILSIKEQELELVA